MVPGPGYCHFPAHYTEDYFNQLVAEKRQTKNVNGKAVRTWVLKSSGIRNEALDCRVYARSAFELLNVNLQRVAERMNEAKKHIQHDAPAPVTRRRRRMVSRGVT